MLWALDRGLIPSNDPVTFLPTQPSNTHLVYTLENLMSNLPNFLKNRCVREELVSQLREITQSYNHLSIDQLGANPQHERAFLIFCFFSNSYVNACEENAKNTVPKEISIPLMRAAFLAGRKPVLGYPSYCLYNWRKQNNDFEIMDTFSGSEDEKLMIRTFLEMEIRAVEIIKNPFDISNVRELLEEILENFKISWSKIDWELLANFECCHNSYNKVTFENSGLPEQSFPGEILTQTPFLRLIYKVLGIKFQNKKLVDLEESLAALRPEKHNSYLNSIRSIREKSPKKNSYNASLDVLTELLDYIYCPIYSEACELNEIRKEEIRAFMI